MRLGFIFILLFSFIQAKSQTDLEGYFMFPINPGQQNLLAGTMGELRASHFHAGIDIKTGGQIGLPVYASADGYVWRVRVSTGGYGNAIYLKHANGTTTVYAHLDRFGKKIAQYILENQYKEQSFTVQMFPSKEELPVKKGDIIAYSGNTGSSSGPHLHFEIRDKDQNVLDPLLYGFDEIRDTQAPLLKRIAFVSLEKEARVNHTFGRQEFEVIKTSTIFTTRTPIRLSGKIGVEVYGYDRQDDVWSKNGISEIVMKIDGDTIFEQNKSKLSFSHQRSILAHMDYAAYKQKGLKYNKLFVDDGNTNTIYEKPSSGFVFNDSTHRIQIYLKDTYGNISTFETQVNNRRIVNKPVPKIKDFEIFRNFVHFKANYETTPNLIPLFFGQAFVDLSPYRVDKSNAYYVWDLREGLPDSINFCGDMIQTGITGEIPSNTEIAYYNHSSDLLFSKKTLFDTLYLRFEKSFDSTRNLELFKYKHADIPLKSYVDITLKPELKYPDSTTSVYSVFRNKLNYMGGEWVDEEIKFKTRDLVTYTLAQDTIPPTVTFSRISKNVISFKISDDLSGIKSYEATLDGQFILMKYEPKKNLIWSERLDKNIPLKGEFILEVSDNTNNKTSFKKTL
ncbi:MAG: M23 family metallopeptidase [Cyclobacteriaceae bacterium]